jgi:hypothetical protein
MRVSEMPPASVQRKVDRQVGAMMGMKPLFKLVGEPSVG